LKTLKCIHWEEVTDQLYNLVAICSTLQHFELVCSDQLSSAVGSSTSRDSPIISAGAILSWLQSSAATLKTLVIFNAPYIEGPIESMQGFSTLSRFGIEYRYIQCEKVETLGALSTLLVDCPQLRHLTLRGVDPIHHKTSLTIQFDKFVNLVLASPSIGLKEIKVVHKSTVRYGRATLFFERWARELDAVNIGLVSCACAVVYNYIFAPRFADDGRRKDYKPNMEED